MDLSQKIIAAILAGFFLVALIRVFSSPFRLALKLLLNTLLGFLALGAVRLTAGLTGSSPRASKYQSFRCQPISLPANRQIVRDGGAGMETDSSRPASTRSRTSVSFSDSFPMT